MAENRNLWWLAAAAGMLCVSCATVADYDFSTVNYYLREGDYTAVYQTLDADNALLYSEHDKVLAALDKGIISHYEGEYTRSNEELTVAEQKIYEYVTKSISQSISSFLLNDTVVDYAGETYEDIYTNLFMALNYIHLDDIENAFVEIRRFDNKLKNISSRYADLIAQANLENARNGAGQIVPPDVEFHNSALARYVSLLLYRSAGQPDSARIDFRYIQSAFSLQPDLYPFSVPSSIEQELTVPVGSARFNLIAFTGLSPFKEEEIVRLVSPDGSLYYKMALPVMKKVPSVVDSVEIQVVPSDAESPVLTVPMERIESIERIALDTFEQKQALVYLKSVARSVSKAAATTGFSSAAESAEDATAGLIFQLLQFASMITTEVTERADVRSSRFFPGTAWVTGVTLPPGTYTVTVVYKNNSGRIIYQDQQKAVVSAGRINLMESVCLR